MTERTARLHEFYRDLPYTMQFYRDEDGDFVGRVVELQGCIAHGDTLEKAKESLRKMMDLWLWDAIENGEKIPLPEPGPGLGQNSHNWPGSTSQTVDSKGSRE